VNKKKKKNFEKRLLFLLQVKQKATTKHIRVYIEKAIALITSNSVKNNQTKKKNPH
jgi:hypothetical protein